LPRSKGRICRGRGPRRAPVGLVEARRLRNAIVSEVRFLREGLAEFLECDPSISVVGLYADLAEVVALSPPRRPTWCWSEASVIGDVPDTAALAERSRSLSAVPASPTSFRHASPAAVSGTDAARFPRFHEPNRTRADGATSAAASPK
jgi:hypothetical protein